MVTPGDGAKISGSPMTGVSGPRGCDKSTTRTAPAASASISPVSALVMWGVSAGLEFYLHGLGPNVRRAAR